MRYDITVEQGSINPRQFSNGKIGFTPAQAKLTAKLFEEQELFAIHKMGNNVSIMANEYGIREGLKRGKTDEVYNEFDKVRRTFHDTNQVKNSTDFVAPIGAYEDFLSTVIQPMQQNIGKKAVWNAGNKTVTLVDATLNDIIKPTTGVTVQPYKDKITSTLMNYEGHRFLLQSPMAPNPYDDRNQSVTLGDFERFSVPLASYARTISYDVNQREQIKANNFYGSAVSIDMAHQKTLELDELTYVYDILSTNEAPLTGATVVEQDGDVIDSTDLFAGLPYKYAFLESTDEEFSTVIIERIRAKALETRGFIQASANFFNLLVIPQFEMIGLQTKFYFDPQSPVSNIKQAYNYRLEYLVDKMSTLGVTVVGINQCDPNDEALPVKGTLGLPTIPRRNPLPNGKSLYMLLSDNSANAGDILFAPKVPFFTTNFVSPDNIGWRMMMAKVEFLSGVRYARQEFTRYLATTPNA